MKFVDGGTKDFFIAFVVLQGIYFFLWLKTAVWQWLMFWTYRKRMMSRSMEKLLHDGNFPAPRSFDRDVDDYLTGVIDDETIGCETKIKASFELGTINGLKTVGQISRARGRADARTRSQTWRGHAGLELDWLVRRHPRPARTQGR